MEGLSSGEVTEKRYTGESHYTVQVMLREVQ